MAAKLSNQERSTSETEETKNLIIILTELLCEDERNFQRHNHNYNSSLNRGL